MNNQQLIKKIIELENRIQKLEQPTLAIKSDSRRAKKSVVEFLREKKPNTNVDKALVFAGFYEIITGTESFGTENLLTLWRQAKESLPANINDLINKNVIKGLIAEETVKKDGKKHWYVTSSGEKVLDSNFSN